MRRAPKIALILLALLLSASKAPAQFRFDSWTTDNGLPQVSVNGILQTRDGFLWLTTFGGLVRYDGLRFQVFNPGNTKGLSTGRLTVLFEDREGSLWINTEGQGVIRYKKEDFPYIIFHISFVIEADRSSSPRQGSSVSFGKE